MHNALKWMRSLCIVHFSKVDPVTAAVMQYMVKCRVKKLVIFIVQVSGTRIAEVKSNSGFKMPKIYGCFKATTTSEVQAVTIC